MNCGQEIIGDSKFCTTCGTPLYNLASQQKKKKGCLSSLLKGCLVTTVIIIALLAVIGFLIGDEEEDSSTIDSAGNHSAVVSDEAEFSADIEIEDLRDFYYTPSEDGSDIVTLMVYMIGSDLESENGFASSDLEEMAAASYDENLRIVVMTGGSTYWYNDFVDSSTCQYWEIINGEFVEINSDIGLVSMTSTSTLSTFINDTVALYPADRYGLVMWNHGGGTITGFGVDEYFPDDLLSLADISNALADTGIKFDFIGFDACLMATVETAFMLEPYADYLIASEETEPGDGWYHTSWISMLAEDTSVSTLELGACIIDDFVYWYDELYGYGQDATLSIVELRQMPYTYQMLCEYFANASIALEENEFAYIAKARSDAKSYGEGEYEQVDAIDFVQRADYEGSEEVIAAINSAVKYSNTSSYVDDSYGLAMYFPYDYLEYYSEVRDIMNQVGYTEEYTAFFNEFISAMLGGQSDASIEPSADYSDQEWYDEDVANSYMDTVDHSAYETLIVDEKGDGFVLSLSDEEWDLITGIELQALLDDGEGYIDLGSDCMYEFDNDGDLKIEFDYTWVTIDGYTVPFYHEFEEVYEDGTFISYGYVPAVLNDTEYIELVVQWDSENLYGYIVGYRKYTEGVTPSGKGLFDLKPGDQLEWVFDYYDYDLYYIDSYILLDPYIVPSTEIEVSYDYVGDMDALVYFVLTDIYNNSYTSECIVYTG